MIRAIDHMVILVDDLDSAITSYTTLGFTVAPGGTHADGATHNALVVFDDDTYLELIAFVRPAPAHQWWHHRAAGEGLIDYALLPGAIDDDIAAARARGLVISTAQPGGRLRPDGQRVAWQTSRPAVVGLPFLCGDLTDRALRVPRGDLRRHANGVVGIAGVEVLVEDVWAAAEQYQALLGGAAGPTFPLGTATITLVAPLPGVGAGDPLRMQLERRGAGPYGLTLRGARPGSLDPALTHGVPIDIVP